MKSCPTIHHRICLESWIHKKVLKFANQFSKPAKSLEQFVKSMVFEVLKLQQVPIDFFVVVKSYLVSSTAKTFKCIFEKFHIFLMSKLRCGYCTFASVENFHSFLFWGFYGLLIWQLWVWMKKYLWKKSFIFASKDL